MSFINYTIQSSDSLKLVCYKWEVENPKFAVQILHGMNEHMGRYDEFARFLTKNGIVVYGEDHRGFGKTANGVENIGHVSDKDGMNKIVEDTVLFHKHIKSENPNLPVVLLGHSLGSFLARMISVKYLEIADLYIFTGSGGDTGVKGRIGLLLASTLRLFGSEKRREFLNKVLFQEFNKSFKPAKTAFDSLTRDEKIVKKYMNDPFCTQTPSVQFFYDMANISFDVNKNKNIEKTDFEKPVLFVSGSMCPVGENSKGIKKVESIYKKIGVKDVQLLLYKDARHEILNETNRIEVYQDILSWTLSKLKIN